jgi:anaerobic selenocysteine-containing dehydrogenase
MLCEAMCGLELEVDGDAVTRLRGDALDPLSRGHVCPKAAAIEDVRRDPDRVTRPLKRTARGFEPVAWDEALDDIAARIVALQRAHGPHAVATYLGNPTVHSFGALLGTVALQAALQGRSNFSATSVDQLPHLLAAYLMFGNQLLLPIPDVDRTSYFLMLGANPLASNGSIMSAPGIRGRLEALRARGGRLVVVDPRRTETAAIADEHLAIRPGTDALFLMALVHVITREGLARPGRLAALTDGLDALAAHAAPFTPERVAGPTGLSAEAIRGVARALAAADGAVIYGRLGVCTQPTGASAAWLVYALSVLTGNLDRVGGSMFPSPAVDLAGLAKRLGRQGSFDRFRSRVRGLPEFTGELPVATLADEIEAPGERQIRGLVTYAGNPVLSTPNGARLDRLLPSLELVVSFDLYVNATTRHAHYVLPTSFGFERDHFDLAFHALAVRNTVKYARAIFPPAGEAREDFELLTDLAGRLHRARGGAKGLAGRAVTAAARKLGTRGALDLLLRTGAHGLSLAALEAAPHGVDLGPLVPRLPEALATPRGRIDVAPARLAADVPRLAAMLEATPPEGLVLIGRRHLRSNNSWMSNSRRLTKGKVRCTLRVHPDDAAARGLVDGAGVEIRSAKGRVVTTVEVTDELRPGVVSLPHGHGHGRPGVALRVAAEAPGVSVNDLTDEALVDPISGNAAFSGVPVELRAVDVPRT